MRVPVHAPGQQWAPKDVKFRGRDDEVFANEFGVAADGTDQTANIGRALTHAVAQSRRLVIPPGEYLTSHAVVPSGADVRGFGPATILKRPNGASSAVVLDMSTGGATVSDLTIDGNLSTGGTPGAGAIDIRGDDCTLRNVSVAAPLSLGIRVINAGNVLVEGCYVEATAGAGINWSGSTLARSGFTVRNCVVDRRGASANGRGIGCTGTTSVLSGINIIGNTILHDVVASGHLCIELLGDVGGAGNLSDVVISNNRTLGGGMGISIPHVHGAVVSGNYVETPVLGVELSGSRDVACTGNTILDTSQSGMDVHSVVGAAVTGNVIRGCGHTGIGASTNSTGIRPENVTISGNVVRDCAVQGMEFRGNTGLTVAGALSIAVTGNVVDDAPVGILFRDVAHLTCTGNVVRNVPGDGIRVSGVMATAIKGSVVGNDLSEAVGTPLDMTTLSGGATATGVARWGNAGAIPSRAAFASTDALLIAEGVIVA